MHGEGNHPPEHFVSHAQFLRFLQTLAPQLSVASLREILDTDEQAKESQAPMEERCFCLARGQHLFFVMQKRCFYPCHHLLRLLMYFHLQRFDHGGRRPHPVEGSGEDQASMFLDHRIGERHDPGGDALALAMQPELLDSQFQQTSSIREV